MQSTLGARSYRRRIENADGLPTVSTSSLTFCDDHAGSRGRSSFPEAIEEKIRRAEQEGEIYYERSRGRQEVRRFPRGQRVA
jgi:hypothetical protein